MKLTILQYITPSRLGGAELFCMRLTRALRDAGHRVILLTKRDALLRKELEALDVELHAWRTFGKGDLFTMARLGCLVQREGVDVIVTHLTTASFVGSIVGKVMGVPVVARVPATDSKSFYQFADVLVAVSRDVKEHLIQEGVSEDRVHVLYNGINLNGYAGKLSSAEAKQRLGLSPAARTVGVVASLSRRKGHRFLLAALTRVVSQIGEVHLLFVGEGGQEQNLRHMAGDLGISHLVHFLGFRHDIPDLLAAMDVFCLPSLKEGLSNAVMEAMAMERPVVATNVAGMREIIIHGETGLLVPPADAPALAEALITLFQHPEKAEIFARRGRAFLGENFDQQRCLRRWEQFLTEVVAAWARKGKFPLRGVWLNPLCGKEAEKLRRVSMNG